MSICDIKRDSKDLGKIVNEDTLVTTRYGNNPKKSWPYLEREIQEKIDNINGLFVNPYEVPPFSGNEFVLPIAAYSLFITVNGRALSPNDYELAEDNVTVTMLVSVTESDVVVARSGFVDSESATNQFKTPMDYGAVGNGEADDTTALQAWADGEETYYLGDNDYYFTDTLSFNDKAGSVWMPSKGKLIAEVYNKTVIEFINCPNIDVKGLNIDMSMIDTANQDVGFRNGVLFSLCPYGKLRNSYIYGAPSQALNVRDLCTGFKIDKNDIIESGRLQQINEGTGISIGGAILSFNNSDLQITNNYIKRSWSAAIVGYSDVQEGGLPVDYEPTKGFLIDGNFIYESQSNGIRVQPDNYPAADLVYDNTITNNIVLNTGRTCIRANGIKNNVTDNVVGFDLKPIYGSLTDIPNNGIASNHCKYSTIANNIIFNTAAGIEFAPNGIADYGCEDTEVLGNTIINCVYGLYRSGDLAATVDNINFQDNTIHHGEYITVEGGTPIPAREPINFRNFDNLYIDGNKIKGRSEEFEFSASITLLDGGEVYVSDNKTFGASSSVSATNCTLILSSDNKFTNEYSGVAIVDCAEFQSQNDRIEFNNIQTTDTVGLACDNVSEVAIKDGTIKGDDTESTSAILLANNTNSDLTNGVISNNQFDTTNGINNQIVGGLADGSRLAQFNNYNVRDRTFDNAKCAPIIQATESVFIDGPKCGSFIRYSGTTPRSISIVAGLPIGFTCEAVNTGGTLNINFAGFDGFVDGSTTKTFPEDVPVRLTKTNSLGWSYMSLVPANEDSVSGTFEDNSGNTVTVSNGIITDLGI